MKRSTTKSPALPTILTPFDPEKSSVLQIRLSPKETSQNLKTKAEVFDYLRTHSEKGMITLQQVFKAFQKQFKKLGDITDKQRRENRKELLLRVLNAITPVTSELLKFQEVNPTRKPQVSAKISTVQSPYSS